MDHVKQALSISKEKKSHAIRLYKEAVSEVVRKGYTPMADDAHVDLSSVFGMKYVKEILNFKQRIIDAQVYAESNVEFNYANCVLAIGNDFVALAKQLVPDGQRVDDQKLENIASQMKCILTLTTANKVERAFMLFK